MFAKKHHEIGTKDETKKPSGDGAGFYKQGQAWTSEEDEKLKMMKGENQSWKDIATKMGRPQHELKARWKEITLGNTDDGKKNHGEGKKGGAGEDKPGGGGVGEDKKQQTKTIKKERNAAKKQDKHALVASKGDRGNEARFTMGEWMTLQEDDLFSFGELQLLSELILRDREQMWLRIAGAFFDKTGRRVHQDDIQEKFEEMAANV